MGGAKPQTRDQLVGGGFSSSGPFSVSLSGDINIHDPANPDAPARRVQGHQATPVALALDEAGNPATGCMEGVLCKWVDGLAQRIDGVADPQDGTKLHRGAIQGLTYHAGSLVSAGVDGVINFVNAATGEITSSESVGAPVVALETSRSGKVSVFITADQQVHSLVDGKRGGSLALPADAAAAAVGPDGSFAVVTLPSQRKLLFVTIAGDGALTVAGDALDVEGASFAVAVSPDGKTVAVAEGEKLSLYDVASRKCTLSDYWSHTANVTTLDFSPDGQTLVSGAKDSLLAIWKPADKSFKCNTKAHFQGVVRARFASDDTIFSVGVDNCLRAFKIGAAAAGGGGAASD